MSVCLTVCALAPARTHVHKSEDSLRKLALSSRHVGPVTLPGNPPAGGSQLIRAWWQAPLPGVPSYWPSSLLKEGSTLVRGRMAERQAGFPSSTNMSWTQGDVTKQHDRNESQ